MKGAHRWVSLNESSHHRRAVAWVPRQLPSQRHQLQHVVVTNPCDTHRNASPPNTFLIKKLLYSAPNSSSCICCKPTGLHTTRSDEQTVNPVLTTRICKIQIDNPSCEIALCRRFVYCLISYSTRLFQSPFTTRF